MVKNYDFFNKLLQRFMRSHILLIQIHKVIDPQTNRKHWFSFIELTFGMLRKPGVNPSRCFMC